jgi:hypothetical protein
MKIKSLYGKNLFGIFLGLVIVPMFGFGPLTPREEDKSLAGIQSIQVVVNIGISKGGPTKQALQVEVENLFLEEGIQIIQGANEGKLSSYPAFYVEVAMLKSGKTPYKYFVNANFYQPVQLNRTRNIITQAATWQVGVIGEGDLATIREEVAGITKNFLVRYKKVNPGASIKLSE